MDEKIENAEQYFKIKNKIKELMEYLLPAVPVFGVILIYVICRIPASSPEVIIVPLLIVCLIMIGSLILLYQRDMVSPIHIALSVFSVLTLLAVWLEPHSMGTFILEYAASFLYLVLFIMAEISLIPDRAGFIAYFAKKTEPEAGWTTDLFRTVNRHISLFWAGIFMVSLLSGLIPGLFALSGAFKWFLFEAIIPVVIMFCVGFPLNKRYPEYLQKKTGIQPEREMQPEIDIPLEKEMQPEQNIQPDYQPQSHDTVMPNYSYKSGSSDSMKENGQGHEGSRPKIVAVNGSPHAGTGNTSIMLDMLRSELEVEGFDMEVIALKDYNIDYCVGCGICLEKGRCWINDDHREIVNRLLNADGVILGSPVYFMHVTSQMKVFIDRCLPYGHKPRDTWKPGLAVSVSAGQGEMETGQYLSFVMRAFGSFSVGALTAIAAQPGGFMGIEAVEARAIDLARDLVRAVKEKRRYPANEYDMRFYQFMGDLVKNNKETIMRHDHRYWQEHGFYEGFESYIKQKSANAYFNKEVRDAWVNDMVSEIRQKRGALRTEITRGTTRQVLEGKGSLKEILMAMPDVFNSSEAEDMSAVYQFEVSGEEAFTAQLKIARGKCTYIDAPVESPDVIISTPADVWLAISRGEKDGQQAFMKNQYKARGDLDLLIRFSKLFLS